MKLSDLTQTYVERVVQRAKEGRPLPPGGVLIFGPGQIWLAMLDELQARVMERLNLPAEGVLVETGQDTAGRPVPQIDIKVPGNWIAPGELSMDLTARSDMDQEDRIRAGATRAITEEVKRGLADFNSRVAVWQSWMVGRG